MAGKNSVHHPANSSQLIHIVHQKHLSHQPSAVLNNIIHQTSSIRHLNDCEELVKLLVHRCKKLDEGK